LFEWCPQSSIGFTIVLLAYTFQAMLYFIETLRNKNEVLYYFGWSCLIFAILCLTLAAFTHLQVLGINAWIKPAKFALSTWLYAWAMGWYCQYLVSFNHSIFNWSIVVLL
jgi:hypothetical protein